MGNRPTNIISSSQARKMTTAATWCCQFMMAFDSFIPDVADEAVHHLEDLLRQQHQVEQDDDVPDRRRNVSQSGCFRMRFWPTSMNASSSSVSPRSLFGTSSRKSSRISQSTSPISCMLFTLMAASSLST
uniref:Uncharacterized protein n=1 Tax=Anopheles coluzzii TaxID=1518534 RepID=A0A8W7PB64_ANOCL